MQYNYRALNSENLKVPDTSSATTQDRPSGAYAQESPTSNEVEKLGRNLVSMKSLLQKLN